MPLFKNPFTRRVRPLRGPAVGNEVAEAEFVEVNPRALNLLRKNTVSTLRKKVQNLTSTYNALKNTRNANLGRLINLGIERDQIKAALNVERVEKGLNINEEVAQLNRLNFEGLHGRNRASTSASDPRPPSPGPAERRRKRKTRRRV
jgi:hypothetical protein